MTLPANAPVQFIPGTGTFDVDTLVDAAGTANKTLDIDAGFTVTGRLELPGSISGKGLIRLAGDEIGGPYDGVLGEVIVPITGASLPTDPPSMLYSWSIAVPGNALPDASSMFHLAVLFALQTNAGGHTDVGAFYDLGVYLVV